MYVAYKSQIEGAAMANRIDYQNHLSRLSLSLVGRFESVEMLSRAILFVLILSLYSYQMNAFSQCNAKGDIPYLVTNQAQDRACLECGGPWLRDSGDVWIDSGEQNCEFYAADKTAFSPFGQWDCLLWSSCDASQPVVIARTFFCLPPAPPDAEGSVQVLISEDNQVSTNQPAPPCSGSVSSFLGDNPKQEKSKPDTDEFTFDGAGGDEVTLRLETYPQEGNNGGEASLGISGSSLNESTSGTPPLELNATLSGDGNYSVTVEQPRNSAERFRGSYNLDVESSTGVDLIEPTNNVEK